jgi:hypothetical protein
MWGDYDRIARRYLLAAQVLCAPSIGNRSENLNAAWQSLALRIKVSDAALHFSLGYHNSFGDGGIGAKPRHSL